MPLTRRSDLRDLILLALGRLDGAGQRADVLTEMDRLYGSRFTAEDRRLRTSRLSEEKWQNNGSYEVAEMKREGLLVRRRDGIWELDRLGKDRLDRLANIPGPAVPQITAIADPLQHFAPKDASDYRAHLAARELVKTRAHEDLVNDYGRWAVGGGRRLHAAHAPST